MFGKKQQQGGVAAEYLCGYISTVLEAFQSGGGHPDVTGIITLDVAQKLIWREVHRVAAEVPQGKFLWLRVAGPDAVTIWTALANWPVGSARCVGPRNPSDETVVYATIVEPMPTPDVILKKLAEYNCSCRDFFLGPRPDYR